MTKILRLYRNLFGVKRFNIDRKNQQWQYQKKLFHSPMSLCSEVTDAISRPKTKDIFEEICLNFYIVRSTAHTFCCYSTIHLHN